MKISDIVKTSQKNLFRSKLRTILTISAVFIGTFTISLTNGVGNGTKAYINTQLGNVDAKDTLIVQAKQDQDFLGTGLAEYDPEKSTGQFNFVMINNFDIESIRSIKGVSKVTPLIDVQVTYVTAGAKKYEASVNQFIEGLNLDMAAGSVLDDNDPNSVTIPVRYVNALGFASPEDAVGKAMVIAYKDFAGNLIERPVQIAGVQQESLLGNSGISLSSKLVQEMHANRTRGAALFADVYQAVVVKHEPNLSEEEVLSLKSIFDANGYNAVTLQDQIGTIKTVIDTLLMVLNIFSAIALVAAAFGIINTLFMAVNERTSEIGLMKALGANSRTVFSMFSLEAASIGFWGALLGVLVSVGVGAVANNIASKNFLKDFTGFELLAFPILPSLAIIGGIMLLAFLAGTLPALKASRLNPIKALRYE